MGKGRKFAPTLISLILVRAGAVGNRRCCSSDQARKCAVARGGHRGDQRRYVGTSSLPLADREGANLTKFAVRRDNRFTFDRSWTG